MAMGTLFAWLLVLQGVNMPCSRTTRCCQCHGDRSHDLSIRIPMLYHYVTTLPIYYMFVCLFVCLNWCLTSQSKANGHVGTLPRVVWDFYQKLGRHDIQIRAFNITTKRTTFLGRLRPERLTSNQMVSQ